MTLATLSLPPSAPAPPSTARQGRLGELSQREREVLALMATGRSNGGIAQALLVSEGAVEKHVANIFCKLGLLPSPGVHRRVMAVLAFLADG